MNEDYMEIAYQEAIKAKKENNYDIEVVEVKTLSDAIKYLESR